MKIDDNKLQGIYEKWETEDLIKAVTIEREKYEQYSIELIENELNKRGINAWDKKKFEDFFLEDEKALDILGTNYCPQCHSLNVKPIAPWLSLLIGKLLTNFVSLYKCVDCGLEFRNK